MRTRVSVQPKVLDYLRRHVGQRVYLTDMVESLKFTDQQVRVAMNRMVQFEAARVVIRGQAWDSLAAPVGEVPADEVTEAVSPAETPVDTAEADLVGMMFEGIRILKDGSLLQEDENGVLYKATKLDL